MARFAPTSQGAAYQSQLSIGSGGINANQMAAQVWGARVRRFGSYMWSWAQSTGRYCWVAGVTILILAAPIMGDSQRMHLASWVHALLLSNSDALRKEWDASIRASAKTATLELIPETSNRTFER